MFRVDLVVSVSGGNLEYFPDLVEFEVGVPDLILEMSRSCLSLPALEVPTIDVRYYEDPLAPVFPDELVLSGYVVI